MSRTVSNRFGVPAPAALTNAVAVAAGDWFSLVFRADGTVAPWGDNTYGQINVPRSLSNVVAIAAGADQDPVAIALRLLR